MRLDRDWVRASADLVVLGVLTEGPTYGYQLQKRIRQATDGQMYLPGGTLYPLLHRLESAGLIKGRNREDDGQIRRWYQLTPAGRRRLAHQTDQWHRLATCLTRILDTPATESDSAPA